jgi:CRISPR-associated endonuclease/helicase Cas3
MPENFEDFFRLATGFDAYPFQRRLAEQDTLPSLLSIPTGCGKTAAVVLAWLWRRRIQSHQQSISSHDPKHIPSRLVYCLPMRVLVMQTRDNVLRWLDRLGILAGRLEIAENGRIESYDPDPGDETFKGVSVHLLLGGEVDRDWDRFPDRDMILIGTQDMLLSRALNRGYSTSRFRWPLQFGLLNNDCLWVLDEVQLMGTGLATTSQLQAFRRQLGTCLPTRSLWMSATIRPNWIQTVDFELERDAPGYLELDDEDRSFAELRKRWEAGKRLAPVVISETKKKQKYDEMAQKVFEAHRIGTRTLAVFNTVEAAQNVFSKLEKLAQKSEGNAALVLLHSRFRPPERTAALEKLLTSPHKGGTIAVTTQVVEAGVDVSATTLLTQLAPWASLVQRFGRCNRKGAETNARVLWFDEVFKTEKDALPYTVEEIADARARIETLTDGGPQSLPKLKKDIVHKHVIRRHDLIDLFDTSPDLAGADLDITRFIRDSDERQVRVFFRDIAKNGFPSDDEPLPTRDELCPVPIADLRGKSSRLAWTWSHLDGQWIRTAHFVPGMTVMLRASDGGYNPDFGWTGKAKDKPEVLALQTKTTAEANDDDPYLKSDWQTIAQHTDQVFSELRSLLKHYPNINPKHHGALLEAARYHDIGKAHDVFQRALLQSETSSAPDKESLWAKCPGRAAKYERKGFRHELASAMVLLGLNKSDLVAYLCAAHHGKVRLSIRSLPHESPPEDETRRFARGVWDGDIVGPVDVGNSTVVEQTVIDLHYMELGETERGNSWTARTLGLRDDPDLGPMRLAYMEALLRIADWRASAASRQQGDGHQPALTERNGKEESHE